MIDETLGLGRVTRGADTRWSGAAKPMRIAGVAEATSKAAARRCRGVARSRDDTAELIGLPN